MQIDTIDKAEEFIKNLKRSENWVSDEVLFVKLTATHELILKYERDDLLPYLGVNFSLYYIDIGDYNKSWQFAELAKINSIKYTNNDRLLDSISLQYRIQRFLGNLERAQEIVNEQIEIAYKVNDPHQLASAYQNQGALLHRQRLKEDAIAAFEKSIEFIIKSKKIYYIAVFYISYAGILLDFNEPEKAERPLNLGFKIANEHNFLLPLALAYSNFGLLYEFQNDEKNCINSFKKCIKLFRQQKNTSDEITAKIMLADAYVNFNRLDNAEKILKQTINFSERKNIRYNLIGIYEALTNLLEKKEEYKESLHFYKKLIKVKEEYLSNETDKRIRNLEMTQRIDILKLEKESAVKMASVKHDFLANMSHEIRTPINSILGICYLLHQQHLDKIQEDYITRLTRSGENLLGIINDILDISKIESGKMELVNEPFSIDVLLQDVYLLMEPKANEKKIQLTVEKKYTNELFVNSDAVRLRQILLNIVANALKFTSNGTVTIKVNTISINNKTVEVYFKIKDTGIGISADKINAIFERYEQANASIKNTFGGTGLGLSISKKIAEIMNGTISITSELHKGTTFTVQIPFELTTTDTIDSANIFDYQTDSLDYKHIIIADDNEENLLVAKEILLKNNPTIQIHEAVNGLQVLELLNKQPVDLLFIDLDMPILNGIETVQQIRTKKILTPLKIIGNTASLSTLSKEELMEFGFDEFITKPYKVDLLMEKMISLLK